MMGKNMLTVILLALVVFTGTAFATSWTLSSRVLTTGGNLQVRNDPPYTSANGTVMKTYTTSQIVPVTLSASTGFQISQVNINGVSQTLPVPNPVSMGLPAFNPIKTSQTISVAFAKQLVSVSSTVTDGGSVYPLGSFTFQFGSVQTFTFTPNSGRAVVAINGLPAGATLKDSVTGAAVTLPYAGAVKATFTVPSTAVSLVGSFVGATANAGAPQTVVTGSTVTLSGSATVYDGTTPSYAWTQTGGTPVTLYNANTARPSFTSSTTGVYTFKLTVTTGTGATGVSSTSVNMTNSGASAARAQCQDCHSSAGVGVSSNVFNKWSSSRHNPTLVMCARCHVGADTGGHPGPSMTSSTLLNACNGCHLDASGEVAGGHPFERGSYLCVNCHDSHSTVGTMANTPTQSHYNNVTSAGYPASYVTTGADCSNCHFADTTNSLVRTQWAQSAHGRTNAGAFTVSDFKTIDGCVRCHTTTGFIAYSTARVSKAWGVSSDFTKEVVTCRACHSDMTKGVTRKITPGKPFQDDDYVNREVGTSNLCVSCHSGTNNGKSIQVKVGRDDFTNTPFVAPHYRAAGGILYGKAGYHFPGQVYDGYSSNTHTEIGMNNKANTGTLGPCVACHMSTDDRHSYLPVMTYSGNNIIALSSTACANCHGTGLTGDKLSKNQQGFYNSLAVLKAMLDEKGISYTDTAPFFERRDWGVDQAGADTMGAAYNYKLLMNEPGAFVHNPAYAKKLIADSIDYLYNGSVTGSVDTAVTYLVDKGAVTQETAESVTSYSTSTCVGCHAGPAAADPPINDNGHGSHLMGSYGPAPYLGSGASSCQPCHAGAGHVDGMIEVTYGPGSACAGCHPAGIPSWTDPTRLPCSACHAQNASTLPNGVAAPYKGSFTSTGHGRYAGSSNCTDCHDQNAPHISGALGTYKRLTKPNGNELCASCHNDSRKVGSQYLNMMTHHTFECATCHDPHGTSNLAMIKRNMQGVDVTYLNRSTGLIDTVTWRGLCQVCHTTTKYYRAGVPETGHDTSDCLGCHDHKRGFLDQPAKQCNSCHGYPPVGRDINFPAGLGLPGVWASFGFERYSGGGGAHLVASHVPRTATASQGWTNCVMCHEPGDHNVDLNADLPPVEISKIQVKVQPQYRFSESFGIYTGARLVDPPPNNVTGSCFNISCHMSPSPRWSTER